MSVIALAVGALVLVGLGVGVAFLLRRRSGGGPPPTKRDDDRWRGGGATGEW